MCANYPNNTHYVRKTMIHLDATDTQLLKVLQEDASLTAAELRAGKLQENRPDRSGIYPSADGSPYRR
jgi:hypothetical protein